MDFGKINKCKMTMMMSHTEKKFLFDCGVADWTDTWNDIFPVEIHQNIWKNRYADCIDDLDVKKNVWEIKKKNWNRRHMGDDPAQDKVPILPAWYKKDHEDMFDGEGRGRFGISTAVQHELRGYEGENKSLPIKYRGGKHGANVCNIGRVLEPFLHDFAEQLKNIYMPGWIFKEARNKRYNYSPEEDKQKSENHKILTHHIGSDSKYLRYIGFGRGRAEITTKQGERFRLRLLSQEGERWKSDGYVNRVEMWWEHINSGYSYMVRFDYDWKESSKSAEMKHYTSALWNKYSTDVLNRKIRLDKQETNILAGRVVFAEVEDDQD